MSFWFILVVVFAHFELLTRVILCHFGVKTTYASKPCVFCCIQHRYVLINLGVPVQRLSKNSKYKQTCEDAR